jgi:hypothetical protein
MPDTKDLKTEIGKLVQLQKIDSQIYDLESRKNTFPAKLEEMDRSLEEKTEGCKQAEENLKRLQVLKNEKETEMQASEEKIKKHESELYQIKNNKEYKALQQEIENIKADVSLLEEEIIGLFDEIESAASKLEEEKTLFEKEKASVEKEKNVIRSEEKELDKDISALKQQREQKVDEIKPPLLDLYKRILFHRGRTAMSRLSGEFCSECNMHLRPQVINEIRLRKKIVQCENCARILYVE